MIPEVIDIIIVDDHIIFRESLKSMFAQHEKYHVIAEANDGLELFKQLEDKKPHIILCDIDMPNLDGFEILKRAKAAKLNIPFLFLSFYESKQIHDKIKADGAKGMLSKTISFDVLDNAITTILKDGSYFPEEQTWLNNMPTVKLSAKEIIMLSMLIKEIEIGEIAEAINITKRSAENMRMRIKDKTGAKTAYGLMRYAIENRITQLKL
jgi:DNA-binding NarL/FixJ family response regulator